MNAMPPPLPIPAERKQAWALLVCLILGSGLLFGGYAWMRWNAHQPPPTRSPEQINASIERDMKATPVPADDWGKGWELGYKMGHTYPEAGEPIPTEEALKSAAHEISSHSNSITDKNQFDRGYYGGFAQGYKDARKPAF